MLASAVQPPRLIPVTPMDGGARDRIEGHYPGCIESRVVSSCDSEINIVGVQLVDRNKYLKPAP